jgi:O-acetyl-ADP-ribose deacetylase (regulator of RNase III)
MRREQIYTIGNSTLVVKLGDISKATTDVIVTSDDRQLSMGGGTSKAVREAAGDEVYEQARDHVDLPLGSVAVTGAGRLTEQGVLHIYHAATIPSSNERDVKNPGAVVAGATAQALKMLEASPYSSIAMPALGTGFAGFDPMTVAVAMSDQIRTSLGESAKPLRVEMWLLLGTKRDAEAVEFLGEFTRRAGLGDHAIRSHAVILVHGIRTAAGWRERIGNEIEGAHPGLTPVPVGYGFFDIVRFLMPVERWRRAAALRVWAAMKGAYDSPNVSEVSVIAHSFGTWIIGHLLMNEANIKFHRVVFCGAILPTDFAWDKVTAKIDRPDFTNAPTVFVVNDCGTRDVWPIFAKTMTRGYGPSGRWGFQNSLVRDRFHEVDHSGFFKEGFATTHWVPALVGTELTKGVADADKIDPSAVLQVLTVLKLPLVIAVVAGLLWWYF